MKYTMIFAAGILSASLFTGCNINETSNNEMSILEKVHTDSNLKEIEPIQNKLIGNWVGECHYEENYDESHQAALIFNPDLSFVYIEKTYPTQDCSGDYYSKQNQKIGSYKLGQKTKGEDGEKAYEFETNSLVNTQIDNEYFMLKLTSSTLIFTDEKDDHSQPNGETPQTRNNYFKEIPRIIFTKNLNP